LVSSRQTTARRPGPNAVASSSRVARIRLAASKKTRVRGSAASSAKRRARSPAFAGGNPSKQNRSVGRPDTASAAVTADGPGRPLPRAPASAAAATSRYPGSLIVGMPASDTRSTSWPVRSTSSNWSLRWRSTAFQYEMTRPVTSTPRVAASRLSRRVSSAATSGASARACASSGDASPGRPMGTAATVSVPKPSAAAGSLAAGWLPAGWLAAGSLVFMPGTTLCPRQSPRAGYWCYVLGTVTLRQAHQYVVIWRPYDPAGPYHVSDDGLSDDGAARRD